MAIAHCSVKTVSRSSGRSATAAAAYRTAEQVTDQRTGEVHDYRRRSGVEHVSMHLPAGVPALTTCELWSVAELAEKRKNSTVAREVEVALPHELNQPERLALAKQITERLVERYQVAAQVAVHAPDKASDQRNHHAHILCTTRVMGVDGQLGAKTRILDDMKTGPAEVLWIRGMVETETNDALAKAGVEARIDMRSLAAQGIVREATTHEGPRVTQIRRECQREQRSPLGACDVIELNDARRLRPLADLQAESRQLEAEIIYLGVYRLRRQLNKLQEELDEPPPSSLAKVQRQKLEVLQQRKAAQQWHQVHPVRSTLLRWIGVKARADQVTEEATQAYTGSLEYRDAKAWLDRRRHNEQAHQEVRQSLLAMPGISDAVIQLEDAQKALRRAEGLLTNRLSWAKLDERSALFLERSVIEQLQEGIAAALIRIPTPVEAKDLRSQADERLARMSHWTEIEAARQMEVAQRQWEQPSSPKLDPEPRSPRSRGPRLG